MKNSLNSSSGVFEDSLFFKGHKNSSSHEDSQKQQSGQKMHKVSEFSESINVESLRKVKMSLNFTPKKRDSSHNNDQISNASPNDK